MITTEELETTKRLAEAATPGPWLKIWKRGFRITKPIEGEEWSHDLLARISGTESTAEFIAHMHPQRVLAMLGEIESLKVNARAILTEEHWLSDPETRAYFVEETIKDLKETGEELQAAKAGLKEALSQEQVLASAYVKAKAELDILRNPSDGRCMEIASLREEIKRTRGQLDECEKMFAYIATDSPSQADMNLKASHMAIKLRAERGGK